jgi:apolipoprotein N-acyltransferase
MTAEPSKKTGGGVAAASILSKLPPDLSSRWLRLAALFVLALCGLSGGIVFSHEAWFLSRLNLNIHIPLPGTWILAWFSLIPFFAILFSASSRKRWVVATCIFGFAWNYSSLYWLNTLLPFNPFIPIGIVLLAAALTFIWLCFAGSLRWAMRWASYGLLPSLAATLWVGTEFLRGLGPFAFPWNFMGHSQSPWNLTGCQIADILGVYGVSWIIIFANAVGAQWVLSFLKRGRPLPHTPSRREFRFNVLLLVLLVIFQFAIYPLAVRIRFDSRQSPDTRLQVSVLQPCIFQTQKMEFYRATDFETANKLDYEMTSSTLSLIDEVCAQSKPRLIVLPESAFNSNYFIYDTALHKALEERSRKCGAHILFGADRRETEAEYKKRMTHPFSGRSARVFPALQTVDNSDGTTSPAEPDAMVSTVAAYFVTPNEGLTSTVYDKIRLVPFGETAPILDKLPYFQEWVLMVGSYARGTEYTLFSVEDAQLGVMICFESTFADLARTYAKNGARLLCVITNDGWYDSSHLAKADDFWLPVGADPAVFLAATKWSRFWRVVLTGTPLRGFLDAGPHQHFAHSVFRAIETRRPVLRAANTGISAIIGEDGRILSQLPWRVRGATNSELMLRPAITSLYVIWGDWFGSACACVFIVCFLGAILAVLRYRFPRKVASQ